MFGRRHIKYYIYIGSCIAYLLLSHIAIRFILSFSIFLWLKYVSAMLFGISCGRAACMSVRTYRLWLFIFRQCIDIIIFAVVFSASSCQEQRCTTNPFSRFLGSKYYQEWFLYNTKSLHLSVYIVFNIIHPGVCATIFIVVCFSNYIFASSINTSLTLFCNFMCTV